MFTCPEKDIHSLYIDGELAQNFAKDYEEHIASCEKCRKELEKARALHSIFANDAASINLSKDFMEESYKRLKSRMRFNNVVKMSEPKKNAFSMRTLAPMAAAAAAVFAIMLPLKLNSTQNTSAVPTDALPIISKTEELKPIANTGIFVEGGIAEVALVAPLAIEATEKTEQASTKNIGLKASNFEVLKQEESNNNGMTIRLTELKNMNSFSAANVSFDNFETLDFLK